MTDPKGQLEALLSDLESEIEAGWMPPSMRSEGNRALRWGRELIAAMEAGRAADAQELVASAASFDTWLQDYGVFRRLIDSGAVRADDAAGTVTVRWDLVENDHRKAAVSLATEFVDAYRGRSAGGWPKGRSRNTG